MELAAGVREGEDEIERPIVALDALGRRQREHLVDETAVDLGWAEHAGESTPGG